MQVNALRAAVPGFLLALQACGTVQTSSVTRDAGSDASPATVAEAMAPLCPPDDTGPLGLPPDGSIACPFGATVGIYCNRTNEFCVGLNYPCSRLSCERAPAACDGAPTCACTSLSPAASDMCVQIDGGVYWSQRMF